MAEVQLANTPIHELDASLAKDILYTRVVHIISKNAMNVLHCNGPPSCHCIVYGLEKKDAPRHLTKLEAF